MQTPEQEQAISGLRAAYEAFNRGDIAAAVELFDPQIEWTEPAEFPGGGTYHGVAGAKTYLIQSRESAAEVHSEPEKFIPVGDRIVAFCTPGFGPTTATSGRMCASRMSSHSAMAKQCKCEHLPTARRLCVGSECRRERHRSCASQSGPSHCRASDDARA